MSGRIHVICVHMLERLPCILSVFPGIPHVVTVWFPNYERSGSGWVVTTDWAYLLQQRSSYIGTIQSLVVANDFEKLPVPGDGLGTISPIRCAV